MSASFEGFVPGRWHRPKSRRRANSARNAHYSQGVVNEITVADVTGAVDGDGGP